MRYCKLDCLSYALNHNRVSSERHCAVWPCPRCTALSHCDWMDAPESIKGFNHDICVSTSTGRRRMANIRNGRQPLAWGHDVRARLFSKPHDRKSAGPAGSGYFRSGLAFSYVWPLRNLQGAHVTRSNLFTNKIKTKLIMTLLNPVQG